jgi:hypothetical protein
MAGDGRDFRDGSARRGCRARHLAQRVVGYNRPHGGGGWRNCSRRLGGVNPFDVRANIGQCSCYQLPQIQIEALLNQNPQ